MISHPCDTGNMAFQDRWMLIGGSFVYKMPFWGITKWPPIGGWLLIRVADHSRFYYKLLILNLCHLNLIIYVLSGHACD